MANRMLRVQQAPDYKGRRVALLEMTGTLWCTHRKMRGELIKLTKELSIADVKAINIEVSLKNIQTGAEGDRQALAECRAELELLKASTAEERREVSNRWEEREQQVRQAIEDRKELQEEYLVLTEQLEEKSQLLEDNVLQTAELQKSLDQGSTDLRVALARLKRAEENATLGQHENEQLQTLRQTVKDLQLKCKDHDQMRQTIKCQRKDNEKLQNEVALMREKAKGAMGNLDSVAGERDELLEALNYHRKPKVELKETPSHLKVAQWGHAYGGKPQAYGDLLMQIEEEGAGLPLYGANSQGRRSRAPSSHHSSEGGDKKKPRTSDDSPSSPDSDSEEEEGGGRKRDHKRKREIPTDDLRDIKTIRQLIAAYDRGGKLAIQDHIALYEESLRTIKRRSGKDKVTLLRWTFKTADQPFFMALKNEGDKRWKEYKAEVIRHFSPHKNTYEALKYAMKLQCGPNQDPREYFQNLKSAFSQAQEDFDPESPAVRTAFFHGLADVIKSQLARDYQAGASQRSLMEQARLIFEVIKVEGAEKKEKKSKEAVKVAEVRKGPELQLEKGGSRGSSDKKARGPKTPSTAEKKERAPEQKREGSGPNSPGDKKNQSNRETTYVSPNYAGHRPQAGYVYQGSRKVDFSNQPGGPTYSKPTGTESAPREGGKEADRIAKMESSLENLTKMMAQWNLDKNQKKGTQE